MGPLPEMSAMRILVCLVVACLSLPAQAFFFPFGGVSRDKGVLSSTPLFEPTEGLALFNDNSLAANFSYDVPESGHLRRRATRHDPPLQIEAYRLVAEGGRYRAEPVGASLDGSDGGGLVVMDASDLPYQGRAFSIHSSGEGAGRLILQVEPHEPGGDVEYFLGYAYWLNDSPDLYRLHHQTKILSTYAETAAEGLEGAIEINALDGVRVDDRATLLAFLKAYNAKHQSIFGNTTDSPSTLANLIVAARSDTAQRDLVRMINEQACLLMAASPYEHLRPMGAGVPHGIERADMRAEAADQACRAALRFGADSQSVRYATYRAGTEASTRAGTTDRLAALRAELETLAGEGHLAARTDFALLNLGHFGVPADLDKVRDMLLAEHGRGNPVASYFLGLSIVDGFLPTEDKAQGLPYLEAAAEGGVDRAHWMIGIHHLRQQTPQGVEAAFRSFTKGVEEDEPRSMIAAADMYFAGRGIERQPDKAFELYRDATRMEEIDRALYMMGYMKLHGIGTFKLLESAREFLEGAVARGYEAAKSELGYMYLAGLGGERDIETGEAYLNEASQAGVLSAEHYRKRYQAEQANELAQSQATPDQ
ncbi:tetratricopeptide repeat protein [Halomonas urumqiensis]|uniref:Sel1 repeat family protein n=1 Tax=Halomonas urumqiensis TaxID=1684789 RepID=A0A2N7UD37_9GAMM|nr:tetratricopeptide repeat protein [Halomonas urumqiensis]PMR78295.1 hypothetical protein C1H70_16165 [Halomonas urumqiensis]PTB03442.1 sel1 repeat family protein [Halomonas urumqiensis]GHE20376.1 hypothetical protein GCM10017767_08970 [Halomonas urumqiensis]